MNPRKRVQTTLAVLALVTTLTLGLMAPDPRMRVVYNLVVGFFCLSAAVTFASIVVLIPSVPDPRNRLRRRRDDLGDDETFSPPSTPQTYTGYGHPILTRPVPNASDTSSGGQTR